MRRLFLIIVSIMVVCGSASAQDIHGTGTVMGIGKQLDAVTGAASRIDLHIVSTGSGGNRESGAIATGAQGSGGTRYTVNTVTATAQSGVSKQVVSGGAGASSTATATGVRLLGNSPQSLEAASIETHAATGASSAVSTGNRNAQATANAVAIGAWILGEGNLFLRGVSFISATSGSAEASGRSSTAAAMSTATGGWVRDGNITHSGVTTVQAFGGQAMTPENSNYTDSSAQATGLQTDSGSAFNTGTLLVSAQGGTSVSTGGSTRAVAQAMGISAVEAVSNTGTIRVQAIDGQVIGGQGSGSDGADAGIGTGISAGTVDNSGVIIVAARGKNTAAQGVDATATVRNSGAVFVTAASGMAVGISAADAVTNTGSVTAEGVTATGISSPAGVYHSGNITVRGTKATGVSAAGPVVNQGHVRVSGEHAAGIVFSDSGSLASFFPIVVTSTGGTAWEVLSDNDAAVVTVSAYNLGLGATTGQTFGGSGRVVMDDGTLYLRPVGGFEENRYFRVQSGNEMSELGAASISGHVTGVVSLHPDLRADLKGQAAAQSVSLRYDPPATHPGESTLAQQTTVMYTGLLLREHLAENLLWADAEGEEDADRTQFFIRPYGGESRFSGSPAGFDGDMAGVVAGGERVNGPWLLGAHFGADMTRLHFNGVYDGRTEDGNTFFAGLHGGRSWNTGLAASVTSTVFRSEHRAEYTGGESARARSLAWLNTAGLSWAWPITEHQRLTPEISIAHLWQFRNQYNTDTGPDAISTRYGNMHNQEVFGTAALTWAAHVPLSDTASLRLSVTGGVRQTLTDGEIRVDQFMEGTQTRSPSVRGDRTVGFVEAGVGCVGERISWDLRWQADGASQSRGQGVQATLRYSF